MEKNVIKKTPSTPESPKSITFGRVNYILMIVGALLLVLGYILLAGGGSDDPQVFNPAMFDTRRLYVAPILIVIGFVVEVVAIMYKQKSNTHQQD